MIPIPRNAAIVIAIIIALAGVIAIAHIAGKNRSALPTATTTAATTTNATSTLATTTQPIVPNTGTQNFSPQKTVAEKAQDKAKVFVNQTAPSALSAPRPHADFSFIFNVPEVFQESDSPEDSPSPYWWLDSGAALISTGSYGETVQGDLNTNDPWYTEYLDTNPIDTDGGIHPQNIFRLVSKSMWNNARVDAYFKITADDLSASPNRNESNGILLMNRYQDHGNTLYYAGLRVDGTAVIKKKYLGTYYTMAQQTVLPGVYSHDSNPNLLPHGKWIGLRTETVTNIDGSVTIRLYTSDGAGKWVEILKAYDNGKDFDGTPPIPEGRLGIRTDFMDVQFQNFHAEQI